MPLLLMLLLFVANASITDTGYILCQQVKLLLTDRGPYLVYADTSTCYSAFCGATVSQ